MEPYTIKELYSMLIENYLVSIDKTKPANVRFEASIKSNNLTQLILTRSKL